MVLLLGSCLGLTPSWMQSPNIVLLFCGIREFRHIHLEVTDRLIMFSCRLRRIAHSGAPNYSSEAKHLARAPLEPLRRSRTSHHSHHLLRRLYTPYHYTSTAHPYQPMAYGPCRLYQHCSLCQSRFRLSHVRQGMELWYTGRITA